MMQHVQKIVFSLSTAFLLSCGAKSGYAQVIQLKGCKVDLEIWQLPSCVIESKNGQLYIRREVVHDLFPGRDQKVGRTRLAWTSLPDHGWSYFDRTGRVVVTDVAVLDNSASPFHNGLVRIDRGEKWGLANSSGELIVPLEYDGILEFDAGHWLACKGCLTETQGDYHAFKGGTWYAINKFGKVIDTVQDPTRR